MSLIVLEGAQLSFGGRTILEGVNLRVGEGDRIGLIGPNGAGKSTLFRVLTGEQQLDSGEVRRTKGSRIGYLPQDITELPGDTLLGSVLATVPGRADIEERLAETERELEASEDPDEQMQLAISLGEIRERLEHFETYYSERRAAQILSGLRFQERDFGRPVSELSGGWKMRAALAGLLFQRPDVLFLDEPTNHLDVPSVRWLDTFLTEVRSALVLICHDREFLNRHIERVVSFEPEGLRTYRGDYEAYLEQRETEREVLDARARNRERELRDMQRFVERFRAKATKARQAQSRAKMVKKLTKELESERRLEDRRTLSFRFPEVARSGRDVVKIEGLRKAFGELVLYDKLKKNIYAGDRICIVGVNGIGKTTLLKMIAGEMAPDAGEISYGANVEIGYYAQHQTEQLDRHSTILEEVWRIAPDRGESQVRGICGAFLFSGDEVEKVVGVLSGGERARVLLARLLVKPGNLLLMDEPTNHLDLASSEALAEALATFGGTIVFISHNISFINRLATKIWDVADRGIVEYPGNLSEYLRHLEARARGEYEGGPTTTLALAEERAAAAAAKSRPGGGKADEGNGNSSSKKSKAKHKPPKPTETAQQRKERKRAEAEARRATGKKTSKLRKQVADLEARVSALEDEQTALEPELADPDLYKDQQRFRDTLQRFERNRDKLEELYGRWEHAQEQLAAAEAEERTAS